MLDFATAEKLALDYLNHGPGRVISASRGGAVVELVITSSEEKPYGWIFHYQSKKWLETRNIGWAIAGNGPIIVNKFDGSLHVTGTAYRLDHYLEEYERSCGYAPNSDS